MENRTPIIEELNAISPIVAGIQPVHPYTVAEGYFESFTKQLMARIRAQESSPTTELEVLSPLLSKIGKANPFTAPAGYFNELAENLVSGVKAVDFVKEELETPILSELKNRQVYSVPSGYFESFPELMLKKARSGQEAPVVKMRPVRRVLQYALAAAVIGIAILGVLFLNNPKQPNATLSAAITADSIATQNISKLSDEAILDYVEEEGILTADNNLMLTGSAEISAEDMKEMLDDLPIEEINRYVESHGGEKFLVN